MCVQEHLDIFLCILHTHTHMKNFGSPEYNTFQLSLPSGNVVGDDDCTTIKNVFVPSGEF